VSELIDRLDNDIRELRGAEPGELSRRLVERGWCQETVGRLDREFLIGLVLGAVVAVVVLLPFALGWRP
jgi:hypothetical protein